MNRSLGIDIFAGRGLDWLNGEREACVALIGTTWYNYWFGVYEFWARTFFATDILEAQILGPKPWRNDDLNFTSFIWWRTWVAYAFTGRNICTYPQVIKKKIFRTSMKTWINNILICCYRPPVLQWTIRVWGPIFSVDIFSSDLHNLHLKVVLQTVTLTWGQQS